MRRQPGAHFSATCRMSEFNFELGRLPVRQISATWHLVLGSMWSIHVYHDRIGSCNLCINMVKPGCAINEANNPAAPKIGEIDVGSDCVWISTQHFCSDRAAGGYA